MEFVLYFEATCLEVEVDEVNDEQNDTCSSTELEETTEGIILGVWCVLWIFGTNQELSQLTVSCILGITTEVGAMICRKR